MEQSLASLPNAAKCGQKLVGVDRHAGFLLEPRERHESGADKREFEDLLKQDLLKFDLCSQAIRVSYDSVRGKRGQVNPVCGAGERICTA